jgi:acetyl-CoA C-acetyltransferase
MFIDGLEDAYDRGRLMGTFAEDCAESYQFTRQAQDAYALASLERANRAIHDGDFAWEVTPISVKAGKSETLVKTDEQPPKARPEKIPTLKPAFRDGGTGTAGNSSGINDGASAVLVVEAVLARSLGLRPMARVVATAVAGVDPAVMGLGPIPATRKALARAGLTVADLDLVELNEAFASQSIACVRELGIDPERVNVDGGAIALGHPLGASGGRLIASLVHGLRRTHGRYGLASMCIGVGQGIATIVERIDG